METFRRAGIMVAEATAGPTCASLDERGLTASFNDKKGRVITEVGGNTLPGCANCSARRTTARGCSMPRMSPTWPN